MWQRKRPTCTEKERWARECSISNQMAKSLTKINKTQLIQPIFSYHRRLKFSLIEHLEFLIAYFTYDRNVQFSVYASLQNRICISWSVRSKKGEKFKPKESSESNGNGHEMEWIENTKNQFTEFKTAFLFGWSFWIFRPHNKLHVITTLDGD